MSEKLDKLIKECDDFFNSQFTKYETDYKSFIDIYNTAITRTEAYDGNVGDKVWPRDFFPDKPNIKTYGEFYKWLFNIEYGSVFYNEKDVNTSYTEYIDLVTGENENNRRVTPVGGSGADFNLPQSLKDKINSDTIQNPIYKEFRSKRDNIQVYNKYKFAKEIITAEKFSKKVLEVILEKFQSNTILTKWTATTPDYYWRTGLDGKPSYSHNNIGIIDIVSREYPILQNYYGGTFWFFIENPWSETSTLYDTLIESINENKKNSISATQSDPQTIPPVKEVSIEPLNIGGKIILKVKSGPGVMIGETEISIVNGFSIFKGIQFDQPGDYVISVTSDSPDVEPTEFKVKVTPEPDIVPQDETRGEETPITGSRPIIAQIDQPTIPLPSMEFDREVDDQSAGLVADSIGSMPFVNYMGSPIQDRDIESFKLYHDGIIPKCKLSFRDSQNLMSTIGAPQDGSKFEVFINAKSNNLKSIHLKFKVEVFKEIPGGVYLITGTLDVTKLYNIKYTTMNGTSFEVIRNLCKEIGLGFNSNIINTNDSMTWKFNGKKVYESISEIIEHSYISETSFMAGYIDYYYCFNYVDVEKETNRNISNDVGIETGVDKIDDVSKIVRMSLISESSMNKSCFYFEPNIKTQNNASELSIKNGTQTIFKAYDRSKKTMQVFKIDALTSDGSKSLILKGSKYDKEIFNNSFTTKYMGKMDLDNVHSNYLYAPILNRRNIDDLNKLQITLVLPTHNLNIYKLQKINVSVVNVAPTPANPDKILWRQSGEWIISDITYNFNTENSKKVFSQEVKLIRKELGKSPDEISKDVIEPKKDVENDKVNTNPEPVVPNSVYGLGDIYRVKDSKGEEYLILIKAKTDDGNGIFGQLTSIKVFNDPIGLTSSEATSSNVVTPTK